MTRIMSICFILVLNWALHLPFPSFAIAGEKKVVIATLDYPPYVSESLPGKGWAWEIAKEAFGSQGYHPELQIYPWARAVHLAEKGEVDALYIANKTPEREKWALFSDQVGKEVSVLWKQKNRRLSFNKLKDLKGFKVGGLQSSAQKKFLEDSGLQVYSLTDFLQGVKMLNAGHLDFVIADKFVMTQVLNSMPSKTKDSLEYIDPPVHAVGFYLAVSRKTSNCAEIVAAFNRGLRTIRENGTYQAILKRHNLMK